MKTFITSDLHLGHVNILRYEPTRLAWGSTVEEMTNRLIQSWAEVVQDEDTVYVCGDFAMGLPDNMPKYRARLPGRIILIRGNHDKRPNLWLTDKDEMHTVLELVHPTLGHLVMRHDPHDFTADEAARADLLIHGHLHSNNHRQDTPETIRHKCRCMSVEVLPTAPAPMPFEDIAKLVPRVG